MHDGQLSMVMWYMRVHLHQQGRQGCARPTRMMQQASRAEVYDAEQCLLDSQYHGCTYMQGATSASVEQTMKSSPATGRLLSPVICTAMEGGASDTGPKLSCMLLTCARDQSRLQNKFQSQVEAVAATQALIWEWQL